MESYIKLHIEVNETKAFRKFVRLCSLWKNERLGADIKYTLSFKYSLDPQVFMTD
jgi:hypothetical protein